jgi:DUF1009 family protein
MSTITLTQPETLAALTHIGLIAGEGKFPFLLAKAARDRNIAVTAVGIKDITSPQLIDHVASMHWIDFGKFSQIIDIFHGQGVEKAIMAGRIKHRSIFHLAKMDRRSLKLLATLPTKRADDLLSAVTGEFARENIEILDSTILMRECMPGSGLLTPRCPVSREVMADIKFGRPFAERLAGMDIGQTLVVKSQSIVAVEAMEGTDAAILRAGDVAGEGCVVIKVAKPRQDRRFDVPVAGLTTVRKMIQARCAALAIPGGQALFFEQAEACALAADHGIAIYAW